MKKLTVAALALAAVGLVSTAASAATLAPGATDLVLGFQLAGNNTNLEVDLGDYSQFTTATSSFTLSQLSASDLTAIYGSIWNSTSDGVGAKWSVAGLTPTTATDSSFFATSTTPATTRTNSGLALQGAASPIGSFVGGLNGATSTANSTKAAAIGNNTTPNTGIASSYTEEETTQGASTGNPGWVIVSNPEQTGAGTLELLGFTPGVKGPGVTGKFPLAQDIGTFSLGADGTLTFTPTNLLATPEPSSYALGVCAALLFWVLKRRRSIA